MKKPSLTDQQHALMAAGLTVLLLILLYLCLALPAVASRASFSERIEDLQFQYSKFSRLENQKQQIETELEQLRNAETDLSGFLEEKPQALAAADLQKHIKNVIESNEGSLISTQVVQGKETGPFPHVTVKVHMRGNIDSLQNILYQLESEKPVLFIDNVYLQQRNQRVSRNVRNRRNIRQNADWLETRFEITGFIFQAQTAS